MDAQILHLHDELLKKVQQKELELSDIIKDTPPIIKLLEEGFSTLKSYVVNHEFEKPADEIEFFKVIKPRLFSKLIYYQKIYQIELNKPNSNIPTLNAYMEREYQQINEFCDNNAEFIQYYRSGGTVLDEFYFLRGRKDLGLGIESFYYERDPMFSTNYDFKVSRLLANDMLSAYINCFLNKFKCEDYCMSNLISHASQDEWTDTKSALVELIYGIHSADSVNKGNIDLKVLASHFERVFNIDLGDIYRIFLEIRGRKGERAIYLNRLIKALNKRMDDADAK